MSNETNIWHSLDIAILIIIAVVIAREVGGIKREIQLIRESVERVERIEHPQPAAPKP